MALSLVGSYGAKADTLNKQTKVGSFYLEASPIWARYEHGKDISQYVDVTYGALIKAGYTINPTLSAELRLLGTELKSDPLGGEKVRHIGLYLKKSIALTPNIHANALLGYGWNKTFTNGNKNLTTIDRFDFSAGLGLEYDLASYDKNTFEHWSLFIDYQRLLIRTNTPDIDVIGVGVSFRF